MRRLVALPAFAFVSCTFLGGCGSEHETAERLSLGADVAARVGAEMIPRSLLQYAPPDLLHKEALDALVRDTLLAVHERVEAPHLAETVQRGVLARAAYEAMSNEQLQLHPPQLAELQRDRANNWLLFDRPEAVRTIDVTVPVSELAPEEPSHALALQLRQQCASQTDADGLKNCIAEHRGDAEVYLFRRSPVAADGRVVTVLPQDSNEEAPSEAFVSEIKELRVAGQQSEVFAEPDGFHYLLAVEVHPPSQMSPEQIRSQLMRGLAAGRVNPLVAKMVQDNSPKVQWTQKELPALLRLVWRK